MKHILNKILLLLALFALHSCSDTIYVDDDSDNNDSMTNGIYGQITISAPKSLKLGSRADDETGTEDTEDRGDGMQMPADPVIQLKDGWAFKNLALFICNGNKEVVAYRYITLPENAISAKFVLTGETQKITYVTTDKSSKDYIVPDGSNVGKNFTTPTNEVYEIYALANCKDEEIKRVLADLENATGVCAPDTWKNLINAKVEAIKFIDPNDSEHNVEGKDEVWLCDKNIKMPLSLHKTIFIKPGENIYNVQLLRAYTRIRIDVRNESMEYPIVVEDINFISNITVKSIDLFPTKLETADVYPDMQSKAAIVPISIYNNEIKENGGINNLFDGYILESKAPQNGYNFTLKVSALIDKEHLKNVVHDTSSDRAWKMENGKIYLIRIKGVKQYFSVNNRGVLSPSTDINEKTYTDVNKTVRFLWVKDNFGIKNKATGKYIQKMRLKPGSKEKDQNVYLSKEIPDIEMQTKNKAIFYEDPNIVDYDNEKYKYITSSNKWGWGYDWNVDAAKQWVFIPVDQPNIVTKDLDIPFDKLINNTAQEIKELHRNDFIHLFINVRYNDKSGNFEYSVNNWDDIEGDITFD